MTEAMNTDDPKNPSVPYARAFDSNCPGGKPGFIVFYRQSAEGRPDDWVMERTSDAQIMAFGSLEDMVLLIGTEAYPHARRSTWAEDMLRYRPAIFDLKMGTPLTRRVDYSGVKRRMIVDNTPEEIRDIFQRIQEGPRKP